MANNSPEYGFDTRNIFEVSGNHIADFEFSPFKTIITKVQKNKGQCCFFKKLPNTSEWKQYCGALLCGILIWGSSWFILQEAVLPGGFLFSMCAVVATGYIAGHTLERWTTIAPVVGMTLTGVAFRNFGDENFLEHPTADAIDYHLRRLIPVIILTRGPLGWDWQYIRSNAVKVFSLATLPWLVECLSVAVSSHLLLRFTWYWGIHLGAILASVSPAVVVPTAMALNARGLGTKRQIALLVANAGGLDTAFTEGMFGVINSAIFTPASLTYKIVKAVLAVLVGILLGIAWGFLVDFLPDHKDPYAPTVRSILILFGGLLLSYVGGYFGWGGVSGVAIMVCAGTAATRWSRRGWLLNDNPVADHYKILWRIFEPFLFTLSGYYLEISTISAYEMGLIVSCVMAALTLRLVTAFLVALANDLTTKESLFIVITWIPKAIVEEKTAPEAINHVPLARASDSVSYSITLCNAVLVRVAADSLSTSSFRAEDNRIAKLHSTIIVIAIIITSTLGSGLTTLFGPILLSKDSRVSPEGLYRSQTPAPQSSTVLSHEDYI